MCARLLNLMVSLLTQPPSQQKQAQATLNQVRHNHPRAPLAARLTRRQFKENPDAWLLVDKILQDAQYPQTKCE